MHWQAGCAHLFVSAITSLLAATIRASDRNHNYQRSRGSSACRDDDAIEQFKNSLALEPDNVLAHLYLTRAYSVLVRAR